jgi:hypothetical protein
MSKRSLEWALDHICDYCYNRLDKEGKCPLANDPDWIVAIELYEARNGTYYYHEHIRWVK